MSVGFGLGVLRSGLRLSTHCLYKRCISSSAVFQEAKFEQSFGRRRPSDKIVDLSVEDEHEFDKTQEHLINNERLQEITQEDQAKEIATRSTRMDELLFFFNHCDHVTLGKLIKLVKNYLPVTGLTTLSQNLSNESRDFFSDLNHLSKHVGIELENFGLIWKLIMELKKQERENFGIPGLVPMLPMKDTKNVRYVVGVDIIVNQLSWAVMTKERELINVGSKQLFERQFDYSPVAHHKMISTVLQCVPPSAMYVMCSHIPMQWTPKWRPYQVLMEALLKLCLNHRMNLILNNEQGDYSNLTNYVYHLALTDMELFHKLTRNKEMIILLPLLHEWIQYNEGPLKGMSTSMDIGDWKWLESECRCIFAADIVTRCLTRDVSDFPAAYFPMEGKRFIHY